MIDESTLFVSNKSLITKVKPSKELIQEILTIFSMPTLISSPIITSDQILTRELLSNIPVDDFFISAAIVLNFQASLFIDVNDKTQLSEVLRKMISFGFFAPQIYTSENFSNEIKSMIEFIKNYLANSSLNISQCSAATSFLLSSISPYVSKISLFSNLLGLQNILDIYLTKKVTNEHFIPQFFEFFLSVFMILTLDTKLNQNEFDILSTLIKSIASTLVTKISINLDYISLIRKTLDLITNHFISIPIRIELLNLLISLCVTYPNSSSILTETNELEKIAKFISDYLKSIPNNHELNKRPLPINLDTRSANLDFQNIKAITIENEIKEFDYAYRNIIVTGLQEPETTEIIQKFKQISTLMQLISNLCRSIKNEKVSLTHLNLLKCFLRSEGAHIPSGIFYVNLWATNIAKMDYEISSIGLHTCKFYQYSLEHTFFDYDDQLLTKFLTSLLLWISAKSTNNLALLKDIINVFQTCVISVRLSSELCDMFLKSSKIGLTNFFQAMKETNFPNLIANDLEFYMNNLQNLSNRSNEDSKRLLNNYFLLVRFILDLTQDMDIFNYAFSNSRFFKMILMHFLCPTTVNFSYMMCIRLFNQKVDQIPQLVEIFRFFHSTLFKSKYLNNSIVDKVIQFCSIGFEKAGKQLGQIFIDNHTFDILVNLTSHLNNSIESLMDLFIAITTTKDHKYTPNIEIFLKLKSLTKQNDSLSDFLLKVAFNDDLKMSKKRKIVNLGPLSLLFQVFKEDNEKLEKFLKFVHECLRYDMIELCQTAFPTQLILFLREYRNKSETDELFDLTLSFLKEIMAISLSQSDLILFFQLFSFTKENMRPFFTSHLLNTLIDCFTSHQIASRSFFSLKNDKDCIQLPSISSEILNAGFSIQIELEIFDRCGQIIHFENSDKSEFIDVSFTKEHFLSINGESFDEKTLETGKLVKVYLTFNKTELSFQFNNSTISKKVSDKFKSTFCNNLIGYNLKSNIEFIQFKYYNKNKLIELFTFNADSYYEHKAIYKDQIANVNGAIYHLPPSLLEVFNSIGGVRLLLPILIQIASTNQITIEQKESQLNEKTESTNEDNQIDNEVKDTNKNQIENKLNEIINEIESNQNSTINEIQNNNENNLHQSKNDSQTNSNEIKDQLQKNDIPISNETNEHESQNNSRSEYELKQQSNEIQNINETNSNQSNNELQNEDKQQSTDIENSNEANANDIESKDNILELVLRLISVIFKLSEQEQINFYSIDGFKIISQLFNSIPFEYFDQSVFNQILNIMDSITHKQLLNQMIEFVLFELIHIPTARSLFFNTFFQKVSQMVISQKIDFEFLNCKNLLCILYNIEMSDKKFKLNHLRDRFFAFIVEIGIRNLTFIDIRTIEYFCLNSKSQIFQRKTIRLFTNFIKKYDSHYSKIISSIPFDQFIDLFKEGKEKRDLELFLLMNQILGVKDCFNPIQKRILISKTLLEINYSKSFQLILNVKLQIPFLLFFLSNDFNLTIFKNLTKTITNSEFLENEEFFIIFLLAFFLNEEKQADFDDVLKETMNLWRKKVNDPFSFLHNFVQQIEFQTNNDFSPFLRRIYLQAIFNNFPAVSFENILNTIFRFLFEIPSVDSYTQMFGRSMKPKQLTFIEIFKETNKKFELKLNFSMRYTNIEWIDFEIAHLLCERIFSEPSISQSQNTVILEQLAYIVGNGLSNKVFYAHSQKLLKLIKTVKNPKSDTENSLSISRKNSIVILMGYLARKILQQNFNPSQNSYLDMIELFNIGLDQFNTEIFLIFKSKGDANFYLTNFIQKLTTLETEYENYLTSMNPSEISPLFTKNLPVSKQIDLTTTINYVNFDQFILILETFLNKYKQLKLKSIKSFNKLFVEMNSDNGPWKSPEIFNRLFYKLSKNVKRSQLIPNLNYSNHKDASLARDLGSYKNAKIELNKIYHIKKFSNLKLIDFNEFEEEDNYKKIESNTEIMICQAQLVTLKKVHSGELNLTKTTIIFNSKSKWVKIKLSTVKKIFLRRYLFADTAIEIFTRYSKSYFVNFMNQTERSKFLFNLTQLKISNIKFIQKKFDDIKLLTKKLIKKWQNSEISNFEYLQKLNLYAGRSFNDLSQYPVFPWILSNYSSNEIDLNEISEYRDLSKPIGAIDMNRLMLIKERMNESVGDETKFLYSALYSSPAVVIGYLIRMEPFTSLHVQLQSNRFDVADRLFVSIPAAYESATKSQQDFRELIPEFFVLPDFLENQNNFDLGVLASGQRVNDVVLPKWAKNSRHFIEVNKMALESKYVKLNIHKWIDLMFGPKSRGKKALESDNVFSPSHYEASIENANEEELTFCKEYAACFGCACLQIFDETPDQFNINMPKQINLLADKILNPKPTATNQPQTDTTTLMNTNQLMNPNRNTSQSLNANKSDENHSMNSQLSNTNQSMNSFNDNQSVNASNQIRYNSVSELQSTNSVHENQIDNLLNGDFNGVNINSNILNLNYDKKFELNLNSLCEKAFNLNNPIKHIKTSKTDILAVSSDLSFVLNDTKGKLLCQIPSIFKSVQPFISINRQRYVAVGLKWSDEVNFYHVKSNLTIQPFLVQDFNSNSNFITAIELSDNFISLSFKDCTLRVFKFNKEIEINTQVAFLTKHTVPISFICISESLGVVYSLSNDGYLSSISLDNKGRFIKGVYVGFTDPSLMIVSKNGFVSICFNGPDYSNIYVFDQNLEFIIKLLNDGPLECWTVAEKCGSEFLIVGKKFSQIVCFKLPYLEVVWCYQIDRKITALSYQKYPSSKLLIGTSSGNLVTIDVIAE